MQLPTGISFWSRSLRVARGDSGLGLLRRGPGGSAPILQPRLGHSEAVPRRSAEAKRKDVDRRALRYRRRGAGANEPSTCGFA